MTAPAARTVLLRDGRELLLRPADPTDAPALHELGLLIHHEGHGVSRTVAEFQALGLHYAELSLAPPAGSIRIVAVDGAPALAGEVTLWRDTGERTGHGATLGISVRPDRQGTGLGRLLMNEALGWAATETGLHRIELHVLADNTRAQALYESCGFRTEGARVNGVRRADGSFMDEVLMARLAPFA